MRRYDEQEKKIVAWIKQHLGRVL